RRRHTRSKRDWSSDVCSSDLEEFPVQDEIDEVDADEVEEDDVEEDEDDDSTALAESDEDEDTKKKMDYCCMCHRTESQGAKLLQIGRASCRERGEKTGSTGD